MSHIEALFHALALVVHLFGPFSTSTRRFRLETLIHELGVELHSHFVEAELQEREVGGGLVHVFRKRQPPQPQFDLTQRVERGSEV